jgi:hypothetical protein
MNRFPARPIRLCAVALTLALAAVVVPDASARQTADRRQTPSQAAPVERGAPQVERLTTERVDAETTRREFMDLLQRHPPSVGRVLKLDPSLLRNEGYLAAYPALRGFLAENPEVEQSPTYYLESIRAVTDEYRPSSPQQQLVEATLAGLAGFTAFAIVTGTLIWIVRTTLDHRRWNRLSKIQAEVHTKLMDRFSSNEELLTYVQTPSGKRFLESGPSPLQEWTTPSISAPFSRILWSLQLGSVLLVTGLGLLFLSGRALLEARDFFYIAGFLATALGAGFVVSAAAAYALSRRLGLLEPPAQTHA